jgi:hypothetical protein
MRRGNKPLQTYAYLYQRGAAALLANNLGGRRVNEKDAGVSMGKPLEKEKGHGVGAEHREKRGKNNGGGAEPVRNRSGCAWVTKNPPPPRGRVEH